MDSTIDDLYDQLGGMGTFQWLVILSVASTQLTIGWSMQHLSYAGYVPDFTCLEVGENETSRHGNSSLNVCRLNGTLCAGYIFHGDESSIVADWKLVCDSFWMLRLLALLQVGGLCLGAVMAGQLGDVFGRRMTLYSFVLQHIIFNFLAAYSPSWLMFAVTTFFIGVGVGAILVIVVPYQMEFLPRKWRPIVTALPWWTVSVGLFTGAAPLLNDWSNLHLTCCLFSVPALICSVFVPESVRYLAVKGEIKRAELVLVRVSHYNNKPLPTNTRALLENLAQYEKKYQGKGKLYLYIHLFGGWRRAKISLILALMWFTLAASSYIVPVGSTVLAQNALFNTFLCELLEIPFKLSTIYFLNRIGRPKSSMIFFLLTMLFTLGCLLVELLTPADVKGAWLLGLSLGVRVMASTAWACLQTWTAESYPTYVRSLGYGLSSTSARLAGLAAYYAVDVSVDADKVNYIVMIIALTCCTLLTLFVPETRNSSLPDSLDISKPHPVKSNNEDKKLLIREEKPNGPPSQANSETTNV